MVKNKHRLYVVCFFRIPQEGGNPDPYHWALSAGPKGGGMEGMFLYHVQNVPTSDGVRWQLEEPPRDLSLGATPAMLTFTAIAKIENLQRLQQIIRAVPVNPTATWEVFNCQMWVESALAAIVKDKRCLGTNSIPATWPMLRDRCTSFSERYRQNKIRGQALPNPRPMQNLLSS